MTRINGSNQTTPTSAVETADPVLEEQGDPAPVEVRADTEATQDTWENAEEEKGFFAKLGSKAGEKLGEAADGIVDAAKTKFEAERANMATVADLVSDSFHEAREQIEAGIKIGETAIEGLEVGSRLEGAREAAREMVVAGGEAIEVGAQQLAEAARPRLFPPLEPDLVLNDMIDTMRETIAHKSTEILKTYSPQDIIETAQAVKSGAVNLYDSAREEYVNIRQAKAEFDVKVRYELTSLRGNLVTDISIAAASITAEHEDKIRGVLNTLQETHKAAAPHVAPLLNATGIPMLGTNVVVQTETLLSLSQSLVDVAEEIDADPEQFRLLLNPDALVDSLAELEVGQQREVSFGASSKLALLVGGGAAKDFSAVYERDPANPTDILVHYTINGGVSVNVGASTADSGGAGAGVRAGKSTTVTFRFDSQDPAQMNQLRTIAGATMGAIKSKPLVTAFGERLDRTSTTQTGSATAELGLPGVIGLDAHLTGGYTESVARAPDGSWNVTHTLELSQGRSAKTTSMMLPSSIMDGMEAHRGDSVKFGDFDPQKVLRALNGDLKGLNLQLEAKASVGIERPKGSLNPLDTNRIFVSLEADFEVGARGYAANLELEIKKPAELAHLMGMSVGQLSRDLMAQELNMTQIVEAAEKAGANIDELVGVSFKVEDRQTQGLALDVRAAVVTAAGGMVTHTTRSQTWDLIGNSKPAPDTEDPSLRLLDRKVYG